MVGQLLSGNGKLLQELTSELGLCFRLIAVCCSQVVVSIVTLKCPIISLYIASLGHCVEPRQLSPAGRQTGMWLFFAWFTVAVFCHGLEWAAEHGPRCRPIELGWLYSTCTGSCTPARHTLSLCFDFASLCHMACTRFCVVCMSLFVS
jgi:hypothetical protein